MISYTTFKIIVFGFMIIHTYLGGSNADNEIREFVGLDIPYFVNTGPLNVSTTINEVTVLKCAVKNLGNRTVSWMRKLDLHILTTNSYTYTGDLRFSVASREHDEESWDLKIKNVKVEDSGIYECQVNTEPKLNRPVYLKVTTPRAQIMGATVLRVTFGDTISLACKVNVLASSIQWIHEGKIVDFESPRGGISLETEKSNMGTTSRLMLTRATYLDSGNYTCAPVGATPVSAIVRVTYAAVKTNNQN